MKKLLTHIFNAKSSSVYFWLIFLGTLQKIIFEISLLNFIIFFFLLSVYFITTALIKISEKEKVQINLSVMDEQRLKRIEEKLGLKNKFD